MKKLLALLLALVMIVGCFALSACSDDTTDPGDQTPGSTDDGCKHTGGEATCQKKAVCATCGEEYGALAEHDYNKDDVCKVCGAADPEAEAEKKAAEEAAAPVIELIKALENLPEVTADNIADIQAKYDTANDAYKALESAAKNVIPKETKDLLTAAKKAIDAYEDALKAAAALQEYYETLGSLPTTSVTKHTVTLDGQFDDVMLEKCTSMTLTMEQCKEWDDDAERVKDGAGLAAGNNIPENNNTDVSFYILYDDEYLYIVEWRCDLSWCFSAKDYTQSYTGDGSLLWFVNTGDAEQWLSSGTMTSAPACGLMWNAGVRDAETGDKPRPGDNVPQVAYFDKNDQSVTYEKTASGDWNYSLKYDDTMFYYIFELAIPWADLPFTMADLEAGDISATFCSVDIWNEEYPGGTDGIWDNGYQMQYPGVNNWHLAYPLVPEN